VCAENVIRGPHGASSYSWMRPPSRSDLRNCVIPGGEVGGGTGDIESGTVWSRDRCGRYVYDDLDRQFFVVTSEEPEQLEHSDER
jgi:hypothetical protein